MTPAKLITTAATVPDETGEHLVPPDSWNSLQ